MNRTHATIPAHAHVPFHKPYITEEEVAEVLDSLRSGWLTMGPKTIAFEGQFRDYIGCRNAVSVNSCTAGLHLSLMAIGLQEGDEVILPTLTFTATAEVVTYFRAKPVLVDIEEGTCNIDAGRIEEKITERTKAIVPVHYAGQPCDLEEICRVAEEHGISVIEDAAHAVPASYRGKKIGTIGELTCFSFYATKSLTTGEGGMITTENDEWAERMRILRLHGISKDAWKRYTNEGSWFYDVIEPGYKYNMTDIQAAIGVAQLKKLQWMLEKREKIAKTYTAGLASTDRIILPSVKPDRQSAWHLYVIRVAPGGLLITRNRFIEELKDMGVMSSVHFIPLYRHGYYRNSFQYRPTDFPVSELIYEQMISLPIYPGMSDDDVSFVIDSVLHLVNKFKR